MDLTLVLPLKGRTRFTERWLRWAESERIPFPVLIADGSAEEDARVHEALVHDAERWPHLRLDYRRYPHDADLSIFYAKLADAFARVRTPFAALMDNDDFPVAAGLEACLRFLAAHPDHAACGGELVGLMLPPRKGREAGFYGDGARFERRQVPVPVDGTTALARVEAHFARYQVTWYDPAPTKILAEVFAAVREQNFKDVLLAEILASHLLLCRGPVGKLTDLMLIRQYEAAGSTAAAGRKRGADDELPRLLDAIAAAVSAGPGAREAVERAYALYLDSGRSRPAPQATLRGLIGRGLDAAGLASLRGRANRAKAASWAGPESAAALERVASFLAAGPGVTA